ncbi:hypothetical protein E2R23_03920 [Burkholderia pseudomallei]|nr:hypothetical protein EXY28_03900 [Burkholderia pseudomallei]QBI45799.1 hypothetical protein EXY72_03925 [Burkholderia pseudomallei]QBL77091.1 hypothetical protein EYA82_03965 [Burkholderia pseudomallei]QBL83766.1 hypothetical protein EYA88_03935 [Burkholderia pseudomallei]QBP47586.1 hypothetical protein E2R28_03965 [Burkholderia pseudomallei]
MAATNGFVRAPAHARNRTRSAVAAGDGRAAGDPVTHARAGHRHGIARAGRSVCRLVATRTLLLAGSGALRYRKHACARRRNTQLAGVGS